MRSLYGHRTSVKLLENIRQYAFFDMNMVDSGLINVFDMDVLYSGGLEKASFDLDDVHAHQVHRRHREHHWWDAVGH